MTYNEFLYNLDKIIFFGVKKEAKTYNSYLIPLSNNNNQLLQNNTSHHLGKNKIEDKNNEDEKTIPNSEKNND